jgi:hypothetical protein
LISYPGFKLGFHGTSGFTKNILHK